MTRQPAPSPTLLQTLLRLTVLVFVVSSVVVGIALVASRVVKNNVLLTYVYSPTARVPGQFIQLIDLQRNQTQSVMYGVAEKYVPSPNQRYIIYESNRYEGKYCEVRDVHNGLRLIYRTEYVLRCRPMWSNDSRTVVLLTLLLDASFHIILVPIASPQQAQVIYNSEGTWYWYISTLSSDNRML
ncbi:MAG: hypothetical protein SF029_21705, partial [bacterium]|nr:hypothetical protein [bacterium]